MRILNIKVKHPPLFKKVLSENQGTLHEITKMKFTKRAEVIFLERGRLEHKFFYCDADRIGINCV